MPLHVVGGGKDVKIIHDTTEAVYCIHKKKGEKEETPVQCKPISKPGQDMEEFYLCPSCRRKLGIKRKRVELKPE